MKPTYEIDLSNADPELLKEYAELQNEIDAICRKYKYNMSDSAHNELGDLLKRRAQVVSKILKTKVYSVSE